MEYVIFFFWQMNVQKQKGQAFNAASTQKAIDILKVWWNLFRSFLHLVFPAPFLLISSLNYENVQYFVIKNPMNPVASAYLRIFHWQAHPDLIHAFQAVAAAGGSGNSGASANNSLNAALLGETLPRGRGFDERAARAAAEVRKKAAAKGLLIRPHGLPAQALPPLTQLLNIINSSGATPDARVSGATDDSKKEANGHSLAEPSDEKKDVSEPGREAQAPAGLGKGLGSLDAKKQKTKAKVAAWSF